MSFLQTARTKLAVTAARAATAASRATGRGAGGMIGGLVAQAIDPHLMEGLAGRPTMLVTGTNGKSTTTRMLVAALRTQFTVATNDGGDNMDAGIISALLADQAADRVVLEVDELHVAHVADALHPEVLVLLNLSRDQLDRVGEINAIERSLRGAVEKHPDMTVVANCDDPLIASVAWDHPKTVWVSAGAGWTGDAVTCPRTGGPIIRDGAHWYSPLSTEEHGEAGFQRPEPAWAVDAMALHTPTGDVELNLSLPGNANRGNAAQALAAATVAGVPVTQAVPAVEAVDNVAGRYSTIDFEGRQLRLLLAKNPAGWQEALSMLDRSAPGVVIAVNGQVADGEDLSWLWDVRFEDFEGVNVKSAGERGTDLAVRLTYGGIEHEHFTTPIEAIRACPPGRVDVLANYTAFRDLKKELEQ
ncbi:UDP-N-acetylmuramyl tripeptide synthase [Corynebacterium renale]|uniref:MurT ligase domain-containing protein n=1 Tax=Corynebacterium renale TaxID=1724 RepID=UPI000DA2AD45|nr:MurT ligase domain-containing protein [Corynebacterium renale]SQG63823.1 UDP-N-acetylmuramyl tripeptide synthase [Corynebacterium renale]STD02325.1 UDP-N-acetylmuramyl tripeptide synthase [Corynebacterium renale]